VNQLSGKTAAGLHLVSWNMTQTTSSQRSSAGSRSASGGSQAEKRATKEEAQTTAVESPVTKPSSPKQEPPAKKEPDKPAEKPAGKPTAEEGKPNEAQATSPSAAPPEKPRTPPAPRTSVSPGFRGTGTGRPVPNGTYRVTLMVDGRDVQSRTITLTQDPLLPPDAVADEVYEEMLLKDETARNAKSRAKTNGVDVWYDD
jgi:hypothetical protein